MFNIKEKCPVFGYKLENWNQVGYRATAISYLKREGLRSIEHANGNWYTLSQLQDAVIK